MKVKNLKSSRYISDPLNDSEPFLRIDEIDSYPWMVFDQNIEPSYCSRLGSFVGGCT